MFRLFSDDQYLRLALSALPPSVSSRAIHLMDVDRIGNFRAISAYLNSSKVDKEEDRFITLTRSGLLSKKFAQNGSVSLNATVKHFYSEVLNQNNHINGHLWEEQLSAFYSRSRLSRRQYHIIVLIESGWDIARVAKHLNISTKSVCSHLDRAKIMYQAKSHASLLLNITF